MATMNVDPGFGTLFSTVATLASPIQGMLSSRPFYRAVPQLVVRPRRRTLTRMVDALLDWQERGRQRRELVQLDDHMLHDIGITRAEAFAEAAKPFWHA
jgi:uncharacterized protein YjiS (DUF1127 family)